MADLATLNATKLHFAEDSAPATPDTGEWVIYAKTTGMFVKDDAGTEYGPFGNGIVDQGTISFLDASEAAAPATPASGKVRIYAKADGRIYSKDDAGVEYGPFDAAGAGGGGPLLYADSLALHANGTEFADATLADVAGNVGIAVPGDVTAVTTEAYDDTCLDILFAAQGDRLWVSAPAGDFTAYLTIHGTNSLAAMLALVITNDAGTGTGVSIYTDDNAYLWGVSSHIYSATGNIIPYDAQSLPVATSNWPIVYRLAKVSSTITGGVSYNGGLTFVTNTRTDSTTFTRVGVTRLFTGGGTTATMRVGRLNIVV